MTLTPDKLTVLGEISEAAYRMQNPDYLAPRADGCGRPADHVLADWEHREIAALRLNGTMTWRHELQNATSDVYAADDWPELRAALLASAATILTWVLEGDQR